MAGKWIAAVALAMMAASGTARAAHGNGSDNYDAVFERYLKQARATTDALPRANDWSWMSRLALDHRARSVNDLLTIRVVESITASGSADAATSKSSQAGIGISSLFGIEKKLPDPIDPTSLVAGKTNTNFAGSGTTTRTGELSALITARVSDVLANGDLVIEGVREIDINGDRQIVVLTGVVRTYDINSSNTVLSTSIGQLRIRYFGRGLTQDNLKPGWLIRILNKVF
jgi:flagellar L-ring protein precursor FlgH